MLEKLYCSMQLKKVSQPSDKVRRVYELWILTVNSPLEDSQIGQYNFFLVLSDLGSLIV